MMAELKLKESEVRGAGRTALETVTKMMANERKSGFTQRGSLHRVCG